MHVSAAGGVLMEVVLAQAGRIICGGEHVTGSQRRWEVAARLFVHVKIVFVQRLQTHKNGL